MRWLLGIAFGLAVVWCGWWFVASTALERASAAWFADRRAEGWTAQEGGIAVRGFPSRLDLTVTAPVLRDPVTGWGWQAPFAQLLTLSYRPWHLIAALPPEQRFDIPGPPGEAAPRTAILQADRLQASVVMRPTVDLPLDRITVVGDALRLVLPDAAAVAAGTLRLATRPAVARANGHEIGVEALDIAPPAALLAALPPGTALPDRIGTLRVDAELGFSAPLDRHAGQTRPVVQTLDLREARLNWGDLVIHARGALSPDAQGRAEGRIEVQVQNWRLALAAAVAAGWITPEVAPTWERALDLLAQQSGVEGRLDLPLSMRNGRASLGPLPLGPAPHLGARSAGKG